MDKIPFGEQFENAVWSFNKSAGKRVAADVGSKTFKMLSTSTEPFFRCNMGERFFSHASVASGYTLWVLTGFASCWTGTMISPLFRAIEFYSLARFFYSAWIPALVSLGVLAAFWHFSRENMKQLAQFRAEGKTYHSKSRGKPRWGDDPVTNMVIRVGASLVLVLLAPVLGIAFVASQYVSSNLAAQQQAALYDRYLDALDAKIEGEFLQDALLGKYPPENTFLYKPLPATLKPELREDIAAAAVGKPVRVVAQAPKAPSAAQTPRS